MTFVNYGTQEKICLYDMKVHVKRIYQMVATRLNRLALDILVASGKKA